MAFTLRVRFCGMCLFIRDGNSRMHVLLPSTAGVFPVAPDPADGEGGDTDGGDGDGEGQETCCATFTDEGMRIEPHTVRIAFNTAHLQPGRVSLDPFYAQVSLRNRVLDVPRMGAELDTTMPADLVSLGGNLRGEVFGDDAGDLLSSRVTFSSGSCTGVAAGRCWSWAGSVRRMTHVVEWSIPDLPGDELVLPLTQFSGAVGGELGPVYPVNGVVDLEVWHVPYTDLPPDAVVPPEPDPEHPTVAHHFAAMLRLFQDPVYDLPVYVGDECPKSALVREELDELHKGLAVLTCMGGQI
jgi:hypothetical protein